MLEIWSDYKQLSVLPFGGHDLMDQPAYILEGIRLIEKTKSAVESAAAETVMKRRERRA